MRFVVRSDTEAGLSLIFSFPLLITSPPYLHRRLQQPQEMCDNPNQAARNYVFGTKLRASSLKRHLAGLGIKLVYFPFGNDA
jgi:hypothetical protein